MAFDPKSVAPEVTSALLGGLIGRAVTARRTSAPPTGPWFAVAEYHNDRDEIVGFLVCDADGACSLAAALSMVPAPLAATAAKTKVLSEMLVENLHEVFNVAARLFQSMDEGRIVLATVHLPPAKLPVVTEAMVRHPKARSDFSLNVTGYAPGNLALFAVA